MEMQRVRGPKGVDADDRESQGRRAMAAQGAVHLGADVNADVDEYQPPSPDDCGDGTEDYRSGRKLRPPPSSTPPCNPRGKPAHPPPLRPYHTPLSLDLYPPPPATSCSPPDDRSGSIAKTISC